MIPAAIRRRVGGRDRLVTSLEEVAERLTREEQARAALIGRVSHELRTPLTVIKGYVYTLQRGEQDETKAAKLRVINGECERLADMVEDLLELSRARAGQLRVQRERFPLRGCVEEVAEHLHTVAQAHDVAVRFAWDCNGGIVAGDESRVRRIFANLITNGIKYAPPGTEVEVRGAAVPEGIAVSVSDRGRGITELDLPFIFDEFFQAPERSEPGAGLGLAIARELAVAHGGRIDVESVVGRGTRFVVTLPLAGDAE